MVFGYAMPQAHRQWCLVGACTASQDVHPPNGNDFPDFLVKSENRAGLVFWRQPPGTRAFQRNTQDTLCRSTLNTMLFCVVIIRGVAV